VECCKTIRPATLEELPIIHKSIELVSFNNPYTLYYMRFLWLLSSGKYFLVSIGDNGITGYIIAVPLKNATCHIASLAVKPECRRKKVASSLLSSIIEVCSSEGYKNFILEVSTANKPAIRLYLKHGFRVIGILPNYYGKSRHAYLMLYIDDSLWFRV